MLNETCGYCGGSGQVSCDCNGGVRGTENEDCYAGAAALILVLPVEEVEQSKIIKCIKKTN